MDINTPTTPNSPKDSLMVKQVAFIGVVSKIRILGIAISLGLIAIYVAGMLFGSKNVTEGFDIISLATLIFAGAAVPLSIFLKKTLMKKVNLNNFKNNYTSAHIASFAILDFAGLFCIVTNLFVNTNILYASIGVAITAVGIFINFPKEEDFELIKR